MKTDITPSSYNDQYLDLKALAEYSSLSVRTLRDYLADPEDPLPGYCIKRKILVKRSEFDAWIGRHRTRHNDLSDMVNDIVKDITEN